MSDQQEAPVENTPLSDEELSHFKEKLTKAKSEVEENIQQYKSSLEDLEGNLDDNVSSSAHHQGDLASEEESRERYYTLIEKEKDKLGEIKVALDRMEAGNYGICLVTGKAIQKERLEIMPWAKHSVEAKKSENGTQQSGERLHVQNAPKDE